METGMNENVATLTARALTAVSNRFDKLEARMICSDLVITALMRTHPDPEAVLSILDTSLTEQFVEQSKSPQVARDAQQRLRTLLEAWRRALRPQSPA